MLAAARNEGNDRHYVFQHQQRCLAADALTTILPSLCFNSGTSLGITPESTTTCVQEVISQITTQLLAAVLVEVGLILGKGLL